MASPVTLKPEDLDIHLAWMRQLAARILRDENLAYDAVQEACISALENPPPRGDALPKWLNTVVRTKAFRILQRNKREKELHRSMREISARYSSVQPSEPLEQVEAQLSVSRALDSLEEPLRTAVALYYGEGLTSAQVAKVMDSNASTVRNWVKKGRELLRVRLNQQTGGDHWRASLLCIVGLKMIPTGAAAPLPEPASSGPQPSGAGAPGGGWLSPSVAKLAIPALLAVTAIGVTYVLLPEPSSPAPANSRAIASSTEASGDASGTAAGAAALPAGESAALGESRRSLTEAAASTGVEAPAMSAWSRPIRVRAVDLEGHPLQRAPDGAFLEARAAPAAWPPGMLSELEEVDFQALGSTSAWSGNLLDTDLLGTLTLRSEPACHVHLVASGLIVDTLFLREWQPEIVFQVDTALLDARFGSIRFAVADASGTLRGDAQVLLKQQGLVQQLQPDSRSQWTREEAAPGWYSLAASLPSDPGTERHSSRFFLSPGEVLDLGTVSLGSAVPITGRLLGYLGEQATVAVMPAGEFQGDVHRPLDLHGWVVPVQADGSFAVPGTGLGSYLLVPLVEHLGSRRVVHAAVEVNTAIQQRIAVNLDSGTELTIQTEYPEGEHWVVRIQEEANGSVIAARRMVGAATWELRLPRGKYFLSAGNRHGTRGSGRFVMGEQALILQPNLFPFLR